jgi:hypothetical protein
VTGILLLSWLLITAYAEVLATGLQDLVTALELQYDWDTVLVEESSE